MILCVYALTAPASSRRDGVGVVGIAGERLRATTTGRITALVGELPRAPKPTMKNLRRYAAVVAALAERTPAILPARFGTCMDGFATSSRWRCSRGTRHCAAGCAPCADGRR